MKSAYNVYHKKISPMVMSSQEGLIQPGGILLARVIVILNVGVVIFVIVKTIMIILNGM